MFEIVYHGLRTGVYYTQQKMAYTLPDSVCWTKSKSQLNIFLIYVLTSHPTLQDQTRVNIS